MGNCCGNPSSATNESKQGKPRNKNNPFYSTEYTAANGSGAGFKLSVLKNPTGHDISSQYDLGREVGRGEFGITYLCTDIKTGEKYACKSISKKKLRTAVDIEDVRREVEIMKHMPKHPNIVSLKDSFEDDDSVHIVMELCEGGELFDRIVARGHYTERAAAAVMKTIIEVVQICHKQGVMHRDLKPENFLFANKKEASPLKAIDFGLSVFFKPGEQFNEIVGSPYYMAPEVLRRNYGPEIDVWSAGVILYILLCGVPPFWAETEQGVAQAIIRSVIDFKRDPWPRVSDSAKDLVRKMLEPDPRKRLSAAEVPKKQRKVSTLHYQHHPIHICHQTSSSSSPKTNSIFSSLIFILRYTKKEKETMRTMVDLGKQRDHHHLQIISTPTTVDCAREFRLRRTLRSFIECMLPYCCTYQHHSPSYQNDTVSVSSSSSSSSSSEHSSSSSSSSQSNTIVSGTFFGHRRGRVSFCLQDSAVGSPPLLLLELAVPTAALAKEMDQAGVLRIALECDRRRNSSNSRSSSIFDVPAWSMYCNGRKMGFAVRRKVTENDAVFLRMMQSVSVGAGVVPSDVEEQTLYLRAKFERVTGSSDSESFHMMNPGGSYGQELSIFLLRS